MGGFDLLTPPSSILIDRVRLSRCVKRGRGFFGFDESADVVTSAVSDETDGPTGRCVLSEWL